MALDGNERDESTELCSSCSLRNSWDGREGKVAMVSEARDRCDSRVVEPVSLEGRVEERVLSGLGEEKELLSWG